MCATARGANLGRGNRIGTACDLRIGDRILRAVRRPELTDQSAASSGTQSNPPHTAWQCSSGL
jgi:hypothetical protein